MDYHNIQHREGIFSEDINKLGGGELNKIYPYTLQQIEYYLQQQVLLKIKFNFIIKHGVYVPAIIFEYLQSNTQGKENFIGWDYDDLHDVIYKYSNSIYLISFLVILVKLKI
jgi:hypothetical protein